MTDTKKPKAGPPLNFHQHTNFDGMTATAAHKRDVANYERLKASRALKPPRKASR